jgi:hypothetical protein
MIRWACYTYFHLMSVAHGPCMVKGCGANHGMHRGCSARDGYWNNKVRWDRLSAERRQTPAELRVGSAPEDRETVAQAGRIGGLGEAGVEPGHGPVLDREALRGYRAILSTVYERIAGMVAAGMSLDDIVAAEPTAGLSPGESWQWPGPLLWSAYQELVHGEGPTWPGCGH